jgi:HEAT repeat protein
MVLAAGLAAVGLGGCQDPVEKLGSSDAAIVIKALQDLAIRGRESDIDRIVEVTGNADELVARQAVWCLGTIRKPKADEALKKLVKDDKRDAIRQEAVNQLAARPEAQPYELLETVVRHDPSATVRAAAATAFARLNALRYIPMLIDVVEHDTDRMVEARAAAAVESLAGARFFYDANGAPDEKRKALERMRHSATPAGVYLENKSAVP